MVCLSSCSLKKQIASDDVRDLPSLRGRFPTHDEVGIIAADVFDDFSVVVGGLLHHRACDGANTDRKVDARSLIAPLVRNELATAARKDTTVGEFELTAKLTTAE